jgi:hypothetical protein
MRAINMKYQLFATMISTKLSTDATNHQILDNGNIYQTFLEKVNSKKAAQKRASEILKKGEFKQVDCNKLTNCGAVRIFSRFAQDLK